MPELREVFEMVTKQAEPDLDAWQQQERRQRRASRSKKLGALAVAATLGIVAVIFVIRAGGDGSGTQPAIQPTPPPPAVPEVDYLLDLETGEMTPLPEAIVGAENEATSYAVSPDGSQLAYEAPGDDGLSQIFVANLDGTGVRQVTEEGGRVPAWSPDGRTIAYEGRGPDGWWNLFVLDVATGTSQQVTFEAGPPTGAQEVFGTQFTPDGSSLVYAGGDKGYGIRLAPIAGGKHTLIVGGGGTRGDAGNGSMSPDGSLVTFLFSEVINDPASDRWIANADGSDPRLLAEGVIGCVPAGTWSADSRLIACSRGREVVLIDVATGAMTTVAEGVDPIWIDDHTLLVEV